MFLAFSFMLTFFFQPDFAFRLLPTSSSENSCIEMFHSFIAQNYGKNFQRNQDEDSQKYVPVIHRELGILRNGIPEILLMFQGTVSILDHPRCGHSPKV